MTEYTFKRGPVRSAETWTLDESSMQCGSKALRWEDVNVVLFSDMPSKRIIISELVFKTTGKKVQLQCNDRLHGESRTNFLTMCRDVTERLESANPEVRFLPTMGEQVLGWMMVVLGLAAAIWGIYFAVVNGFMDWGNNGSGFALGMGMGAILLCAMLLWGFSPWKTSAKTPAETRERIDKLLSNG